MSISVACMHALSCKWQTTTHRCSFTVILPEYRLKKGVLPEMSVCQEWSQMGVLSFLFFFQEGFSTQYWSYTVRLACCLSLVFIYTNQWRKKMFVQKEGNHMGQDKVSSTSQDIWYLLVLINWVIFQWCNRTHILVLLLSSCSCQQHYVMSAISRVRDQQKTCLAINDKWTRELHFFF